MVSKTVNYLVILLCFVLLGKINGERILFILPVPFQSHHNIFIPLINELNQKGHDLIVITPIPWVFTKTAVNVTIIDVSEETKTFLNDFLPTLFEKWMSEDKPTMYKASWDCGYQLFANQFTSKNVRNFIKEAGTIDLIVVEAHVGPTVVFAHLFQAPILQMSSMSFQYGPHDMGFSNHPFFYPDIMSDKVFNLTVFDKCKEIINSARIHRLMQIEWKKWNYMIRDFYGPEIPSLNKLSKNMGMLFSSTYHVWDGNRPVSKEILFIEGLNSKSQVQISKDLNDYLNDSVNGVIYVCFGTTSKIEMLPKDKMNLLINVLANSVYDIAWSGDIGKRQDLPGIIRVFNWVPQASLLKHPKIKLFITHGGANSISEALDAGIPILTIPIFADQFANAERVVFFGVGLRQDWKTLNEDKLKETIREVISAIGYRKNSKQLGMIKRDQPHSPLRRAVFWTEHVMRHKGFQHHRSPATDVTMAEYLVLDLVLLLLGLFMFVLYSVNLVCRYIRIF